MTGTVAGAAKKTWIDYDRLGKRCCDCRQVKAASEFYLRRDRRQGQGLQPRCKTCSNRNRVRARQLNTGVTQPEYMAMVIAQCGTCAICGELETSSRAHRTAPKREGPRRLNVDHNHSTGAVRALLCVRCNTALGLLGDDPSLLRRAAAYLEEYK